MARAYTAMHNQILSAHRRTRQMVCRKFVCDVHEKDQLVSLNRFKDNMNRCMEVGVCKCSVCELVTGNYNYRAGSVGLRIPQTVQL